ncbi:MAG: hypothetical protein QXN56_05870, partial [Candidatus Hadarchaeum sp.]
MERTDEGSEHYYTSLYKLYNNGILMKGGRVVYPVDLTECFKELNTITEKLRISKAEAVREAIKRYAEE